MKNVAKRTVALSAAFLLLFSFSEAVLIHLDFGKKAEAFSGLGLGNSTSNPFRITTCSQLQEINSNPSSYYAIMNDIDCSASAGWNSGEGFSPIGKIPNISFSGKLDGRNHTIDGLTINTPGDSFIGLFNGLSDATVKNLNLTNLSMTVHGHAGAIAGSQSGSSSLISHVNVEGTVDGDETYIGGLVGSHWGGTIQNSSFTGTVDGGTGIGGLVGEELGGNLTNVFADADVTGSNQVGGLTGAFGFGGNNVTISKSYATGSVTGGNNGGLIGITTGSGLLTVNNSFSAVDTDSGSAIVGNEFQALTQSDNWFDQTIQGDNHCASGTTASSCTAVNTDGNDGDYFKGNSSNTPLSNWNFDDDWQVSSGNYPALRPGAPDIINVDQEPSAPSNLQANPNGDAGVDLTWDASTPPDGFNIDDYIIQYSVHGEDSWQTFHDDTINAEFTTVTGLNPSTNYDFRVSAISAGVQGDPSEVVSATTSAIATGITNCAQLQNIKQAPDQNYSLNNDIDCSGTSAWHYDSDNDLYNGFEPIQDFTGSLNGNNHSITGLYINRSNTNVGLFSNTTGANIYNLTIVDGSFTGDGYVGSLIGFMNGGTTNRITVQNSTVYGAEQVGGVIGEADAYESNASVTNINVTATLVTYEDTNAMLFGMGMAIGYAAAGDQTMTLSNIRTSGIVDGNNDNFSYGVGGVVGEIDSYEGAELNISSLVSNAAGETFVDGKVAVGGVVGNLYSDGGQIDLTNSHSTIDVYSDGGAAGGLIGEVDSYNLDGAISISQSNTDGRVYSNGDAGTGGLIGYIDGDDVGTLNIDTVYSSSTISSISDNVGGLIGAIDSQMELSNAYATGQVEGTNVVGGLIGVSRGEISNVYSTGEIVSNGGNNIGGLIGYSFDGTLSNSFSVSLILGITYETSGGLVGSIEESSSLDLSNNYYASDLTFMSHCVNNTDVAGCTTQDGSDYYYDSTNEPLHSWDFEAVWIAHASNYPTFQAYETGHSLSIHNCAQLQAIDEDLTADYVLANDIDCSDTFSWNDGHGFSPIGKQPDDIFTGTFDGQNHTISGLYESASDPGGYGLFSYIEGGSVSNVTLQDFYIEGASYRTGALAASIRADDGEDTSVHDVTVDNVYISAEHSTGGLIGEATSYDNGENNLSIYNNSVSGQVYSPYDPENFGGMIGDLSVGNSILNFHDNSSTADVITDDGDNVGGLVGSFGIYPGNDVSIYNLSATGDVSGNTQVGGLLGYVNGNYEGYLYSRFTLKNASATGLVTGREETGGLIGQMRMSDGMHAVLRNVHATGDVSNIDDDSGDEGIGGLIGSTDGEDYAINIAQSYATGDVLALDNYDVGGFIGYASDLIHVSNSYATGNATGYDEVGGFIGGGDIFVTNSYANGDVIGQREIGGFGGNINRGTFINNFAAGAVGNLDETSYLGGFIGRYYRDAAYPDYSTTLINNYYDWELAGTGTCARFDNEADSALINNDADECRRVNGEGSSPLQFKDDPTHHPLTEWDFEGTWQSNAMDYPTLRDGSFSESGPPSIPLNVDVTGEPDNLEVSWTGSLDDGGSPMAGYIVQVKDHSDNYWSTAGFTTTTSLFTSRERLEDIVEGPNFDFRIIALNQTDLSDPSAIVNENLAESYDVSSCADLQAMSDDTTGIYTLTHDIDCSDTVDWNDGHGFIPIGHDGYNSFKGTLNGDGHKIKDLFMDWSGDSLPYSYGGLFYYTEGATLEDFVLEGGSISALSATGAIAAYAENTTALNLGSNVDITSNNEAGGLFAEFYSYSDDPEVGVLSESYSTGDVTANSGNDIGGLVGYTNRVTIENSYHQGNVTALDGGYVGGLIGYASTDTIVTDSYATGTAGGFHDVGGLMGAADDGVNIDHSFASVLINSVDPDTAGSIIGMSMDGEPTITSTYFDADASGFSSCIANIDAGSGCTDIPAEADDTYFLGNNINPPLDDWDFSDIWQTKANDYPILQHTRQAISASEITDCDGLQAMQNDLGGDYELANDIDCSGSADWNGGAGFMPVGPSPGEVFFGTLNGNGHTIDGLTIYQPENPFVGLFGFAPDAQVTNLHMTNTQIVGGDYTGGIAGVLLDAGSLDGVTVDGDIVGVDFGVSGGEEIPVVGVGGLVGVLDGGSITRSSTTGSVTSYIQAEGGFNNAGGLVGEMLDTAYLGDSYSSADVTSGSEGQSTAGGAIGFMIPNFFSGDEDPSLAERIYSNGTVSGQDGNLLGGLAAGAYYGYINDSYSAATVQMGDGLFSGGLVGQAFAEAINNDYLDVGRSGVDFCGNAFEEAIEGCALVNTEDEPDSNYFFNTSSHPPLNMWDFDTTWMTHAEADPTLQPFTDIEQVYDITDCEQLQAIQNDPDGDYTLANDIDCSDTINWNNSDEGDTTRGFEPIADFSGELDGNGKTISGLYIYRPDTDEVGIFGNTEAANIHDLTIALGDFSFVTGDDTTAMLIGTMDGGSLYNVSVEGNVYTNGSASGLVVGYARCTDDFVHLSMDTISVTGVLEYASGSSYGSVVGGVDNFSSDCLPDLHHITSSATVQYQDHDDGDFDGSYVGGLTGYLYSSSGNALILRDSSFSGEILGADYYVGGITGSAYNDDSGSIQLTRVHSSADITVDPDGAGTAGGIAGEIDGDVAIYGSYNTGDIIGPSSMGGLVGYTNSIGESTPTITNSYNTGLVNDNADGGYYMGGLVGYVFGGSITDSYSDGDVLGNGAAYGGLVGHLNGSISNSHATGQTFGSVDSFNIGGIAGELNGDGGGSIERSYATGAVNSKNNAGGLVGYMDTVSSIDNSYATGEVTGSSDNIGGLVGQLGDGNAPNPSISRAYSTGSVSGTNNVGGLVGVVMGSITDSFTVSHVTGTSNVGGMFGIYSPIDGGNSTNNYYDVLRSGQEICTNGYTSDEDCLSNPDIKRVNTADEPNANYFKNSSSHPPLNEWDFEDIWVKNAGEYPLFEVLGEESSGGGGHHSSGGSSTPAKTTSDSSTSNQSSDQTESSKPTKIFLNDFDEFFSEDGKELKDLKVGQVIYFDIMINGTMEHHSATVKEVGKDYVIFTIASTPFDVRVELGETKIVNIDGTDAISITVNSIHNGLVDATFRQLLSDEATTIATGASSDTSSNTYAKNAKSSLNSLYVALAIAILGGLLLVAATKRRKHQKTTK